MEVIEKEFNYVFCITRFTGDELQSLTVDFLVLFIFMVEILYKNTGEHALNNSLCYRRPELTMSLKYIDLSLTKVF